MTSMYVVTLTYDHSEDEATLIAWSTTLDAFDASVAAVPDLGIAITVWVEAPNAVTAITAAQRIAQQVTRAESVGIESVHEAEHQRRANAPTLPRLVSAPEVAEMLGGISRQRVHQLRTLASFPAPVLNLRTGPIWTAEAIARFSQEWQRRPGRPKVSA